MTSDTHLEDFLSGNVIFPLLKNMSLSLTSWLMIAAISFKFSVYYAYRFIFLWLLSFRRWTVENFDSSRTLVPTHECSVIV